MPKQACAISERPEPDEAGHADDLAGAEREGDVGEHALELNRSTRKTSRPGVLALRSAKSVSSGRPTIMRTISARLTSDGRSRRDMSPVAQHRDVVGDEIELLEPVRDQQHRRALIAQAADDAKELLGLRRRQRRGRLVEDQECRSAVSARAISTNCSSATESPAISALGIDLDAELAERRAGARLHRLAVDGAEGGHRALRPCDVLGDVEMGKELRILVDGGDAGAARFDRRREADDLAAKDELAAVGSMIPVMILTSVDLPAPFSPTSA